MQLFTAATATALATRGSTTSGTAGTAARATTGSTARSTTGPTLTDTGAGNRGAGATSGTGGSGAGRTGGTGSDSWGPGTTGSRGSGRSATTHAGGWRDRLAAHRPGRRRRWDGLARGRHWRSGGTGIGAGYGSRPGYRRLRCTGRGRGGSRRRGRGRTGRGLFSGRSGAGRHLRPAGTHDGPVGGNSGGRARLSRARLSRSLGGRRRGHLGGLRGRRGDRLGRSGRHLRRRRGRGVGGLLGLSHHRGGGLRVLSASGAFVGLVGRLLGGLLGRSRLFGLLISDQTLTLGLAADAVGLRLFDARRVGLDPDAEVESQVEGLFVGETELFGELVDADLCCQSGFASPSVQCVRRCAPVGTVS